MPSAERSGQPAAPAALPAKEVNGEPWADGRQMSSDEVRQAWRDGHNVHGELRTANRLSADTGSCRKPMQYYTV